MQKTGVTLTRQTPDLTQDIGKGHFQRLELETSERRVAEPDNERQKLMKSIEQHHQKKMI